jgi:cytochrome c-type biogenesis protein
MLGLIYLGGIISAFGPCSLATIPVYLSYIAGSANSLGKGITAGIIFTLGLSLVFSLLGAAAVLIGIFLPSLAITYAILGIIMIIFGVMLLGVFQQYTCRIMPQEKVTRFSSPLGALVLGLSFGFVWTPCVTPMLGAVLILIMFSGNLFVGAGLLFIFGFGYGTPLIIAGGLLANGQQILGERYEKVSRWVVRIGGIVLIVLGIDLLLPIFGFPTFFFRILNGGIGP